MAETVDPTGKCVDCGEEIDLHCDECGECDCDGDCVEDDEDDDVEEA